MNYFELYESSSEKLSEINREIIHKSCSSSSGLDLLRSFKSAVIFLFNLSEGLYKENKFYKSRIELLEKENNELMARLEENEEKIPVVIRTEL